MSDLNALARTWSDDLDVRLTDTCLRDGSHAQAPPVHRAGGARRRRGPRRRGRPGDRGDPRRRARRLVASTTASPHVDEQELIRIAAETATNARDRVPDAARRRHQGRHPRRAGQRRLGSCRIATHCTEADISEQHFALARELGLETVGFLMMSHTQPPEVLARQARIMVDAGCQCVYVVDSAGALILEQTADRVAALVAEIGARGQVGFHGHENLGARRRQHRHRGARGRDPDRRVGPPLRRRCRQHARSRRSSASATSSAGGPASTSCRSSTRPRTWSGP